jgi:sterol 3beta-glucosyltransferase
MRIALATVGTTGDIRPFAALATGLAERGHDVTAITWPVHAETLGVPGVRVEAVGPHADPSRIAAVAADAAARSPMAQVGVLRDFHLEGGEEAYRRLRTLLPGNDLVLIHTIHSLAHAAALDLGIRWASVAFDPVLLPTTTAPPPGLPSLGPANRLAWWMLDRMLARAAAPLDPLLARAGSRQRRMPLFRARSRSLHLVACSPSLVRLPADAPPSTRLTGAWVDSSPPRPLPATVEAFLAEGAAPVVVTFGSMSGPPRERLWEAVALIASRGRRVVVQHAADGASSLPGLLVTGEELDHRSLFARAALVVHHGGAGTTHAACAAGVPSLVVPHVGDQLYWAERLRRLGVAPEPIPARSIRADVLADAVAGAAEDAPMRARAAALAAEMSTEDGVSAAIRELEALAS